LKSSPPSATQTERAVFPHSAFMNGFARSGEKGSVRQGYLVRQRVDLLLLTRTSNDQIVSSKRDVVQGHEARTDPKSEIKSCHAFFPTSALSSGALRMTADREAIRLMSTIPGAWKAHIQGWDRWVNSCRRDLSFCFLCLRVWCGGRGKLIRNDRH